MSQNNQNPSFFSILSYFKQFFSILFKNRELEDEDFLNEIGIENETTLYYMIKLNESYAKLNG